MLSVRINLLFLGFYGQGGVHDSVTRMSVRGAGL